MPDTVATPNPFKPAKREGVGLFIGVVGGTGSGKTYSALRLARGIVGPNGKIAAGDTEGRRMSHYATRFSFDAKDVLPPFRPQVFEDLAKEAEVNGYDVLIIDSFSHEHSGEGGVLDWHDEELDLAVERAKRFVDDRAVVNEDAIRDKNNMRGWIKPKAAHKFMVQSFLQRRIPIIFCLRAEEKIKVLPSGKPQPMGWMPIADKNFGYELTVMITLSNEAPGRIDYKLPRKIEEDHLALFPDGAYITEEAGAKLAAWARGDDAPKTSNVVPIKKPPADQPATDKTSAIAVALIARIREKTSPIEVEAIFGEDLISKQVAWMKQHREDQYTRIMAAADEHNEKLNQTPAEPPPHEEEPPTTPET